MVRFRLPLGVVVCATTLSCAGDDAQPDHMTVRDSSGVAIVESRAPTWRDGEEWTLSAEPEVRIGVTDGDAEYQFHEIAGAQLLGDGRIVVANGSTHSIRYYDAAGEFMIERGRQGGAPGEFQGSPRLTALPDDSILAYDSRTMRYTVFGPDGTLARTFSINLETPVPLGRPFRLNDGRLIAGAAGFSSQQLTPETEPGVFRESSPLYVFSEQSVDTVGMFPGLEIMLLQPGGTGWAFGAPPYGRNLHYAVAGDEVYVGTAERFEVHVYSPDGRLLRIVRGPAQDLAMTPFLIETYREEARARAEAEGQPAEGTEDWLQAVMFPESRAAYTSMLVDADANIWLGSDVSTLGSDPSTWTVFDSSGRLLGDVVLPDRFRPYDIRNDRVLGRWRDEFDIEYIHVYALHRR